MSPPADTSPGRGSLQSKDGVWHVRGERVGAAERGGENPLRMRPRRGAGRVTNALVSQWLETFQQECFIFCNVFINYLLTHLLHFPEKLDRKAKCIAGRLYSRRKTPVIKKQFPTLSNT